MRREVLTEDLRRLYTAGDMAKTDCGGCAGCSKCCQGMGESVVLDPYDVYSLEKGLGVGFGGLLEEALELNVEDGLVLPNLKMAGEQEVCTFLDEAGRCRIHAFRPGICRMFPLGRYYENGSFRYFLQSRECPKEPKTKIKISKWLGIPDLKRYESFVHDWHYLLEEIRELLEGQEEQLARDLNTYVLDLFYGTAYDGAEDFYVQFSRRLEQMRKLLKILKRG